MNTCVIRTYRYARVVYIAAWCRRRRPPGGRIPFITSPFFDQRLLLHMRSSCGLGVEGKGTATDILDRGA